MDSKGINGRMDGWMHGWIGMHGRQESGRNGRMDGQIKMNKFIYVCTEVKETGIYIYKYLT